MGILRRNQATEFGRAHHFASLATLKDYQGRVPLCSYRDIESSLRRQIGVSGDKNAEILVAGPSSGTLLDTLGGQRRLFPLSREGLAQRLWSEELLMHAAISREVRISGTSWLQLFPYYQSEPQALGRGLERGARVLEVHERGKAKGTKGAETETVDLAMARIRALPEQVLLGERRRGARGKGDPVSFSPEIFSIEDEDLRYYFVLRLSMERRLGVLRAANPGTLTILAEHLEAQADRLLADLAEGVISSWDRLPETIRAQIPARRRPRPQQAARLRALGVSRGRLEPRHLWPELRLLISDNGGPARMAAVRLPDRYGDIAVLDRGSVGGEGVLTLSSATDEGGLALLDGQFLEFLPAQEGATTTLLPEALRRGQRYLPVMTSHDGLYRLILDQEVEVTRMDRGTPRLARGGRRATQISLGDGSLGEVEARRALLLASRHVGAVVSGQAAWIESPEDEDEDPASVPASRLGFWHRLFGRSDARSKEMPSGPALHWALEVEQRLDSPAVAKLKKAVEAELHASSSAYAKARDMKTLGELRIILVRPGTFAQHARRRLAQGRAGGHLPPPMLRQSPLSLDADEIEAVS
ncbi:MAG: GH3 auxin-responsive promoter family protein [Deltaproteobacteria bacterium]|nr:GH3 auxin-responsive promoter family protein [Deltaproteobacteria bacterium]